MLVRVDTRSEGTFFVDAGFGGLLMGAPLRFVRDHAGTVTERPLTDARDLANVLESVFEIAPPVSADAIWDRLLER